MKNDLVISEATRHKAEEVKKYIEKKYNLHKIRDDQRSQDWKIF